MSNKAKDLLGEAMSNHASYVKNKQRILDARKEVFKKTEAEHIKKIADAEKALEELIIAAEIDALEHELFCTALVFAEQQGRSPTIQVRILFSRYLKRFMLGNGEFEGKKAYRKCMISLLNERGFEVSEVRADHLGDLSFNYQDFWKKL